MRDNNRMKHIGVNVNFCRFGKNEKCWSYFVTFYDMRMLLLPALNGDRHDKLGLQWLKKVNANSLSDRPTDQENAYVYACLCR